MSAPVIGPLAGDAAAAAVADWIWQEWARYEPGVNRADSDAIVHAALKGASMPRFHIAYSAGVPVGCASIVAADLPTRPDLGPWLANVYVQPAWRGHGLGTALAEHAMAYGAQFADVLYLYTAGSTAMYARLGWRAYDRDYYAGRPIAILRFSTSSFRKGAEAVSST
jgi:GNAT superfamily N-acetyltransferase